jgi:hypothetical protein
VNTNQTHDTELKSSKSANLIRAQKLKNLEKRFGIGNSEGSDRQLFQGSEVFF